MKYPLKTIQLVVFVAATLFISGCKQTGENQPDKVVTSKESSEVDRTILPIAEPPFKGVIGEHYKASKPDYPEPVKPPADAPNVVVILTDDVGFGASSLYGGPIPTPNFERLAKRGVKYTQFHTTALCSPTRASLITGRNHHTAATGIIMEMSSGFPGYNSLMSKSVGTVGQILKYNGYNTSWFGKNHNVPDFQTSQNGPFDLWPTELGFEYFYGFLGADANQFYPGLYEGTTPIDPYMGKKDYILDNDLATHCVDYIQQQHSLSPDKPFFAYYAPGTAHAPHQAPKEWIAKFKGKFAMGYQKMREETFRKQKELGIFPPEAKLTDWPTQIPTWDSQTPGMKKVLEKQMEVYAAALAYADDQIGRVLDAIEETGEADNTLIIYIQGDNGSSAEDPSQHGTTNEVGTFGNGVQESEEFLLSQLDNWGTEYTYNTYAAGWAQCLNGPFQWDKKIASHFGGTSNGMVISWPKMIKDVGGKREQFSHIIDIVPTILEAANIPEPKKINGVDQKPMEGTSLVYTFADAKAPARHTTQYFEIVANRGIYNDGWYACTTPKRMPWVTIGATVENPITDYDWELYNIKDDPTQSMNIAAANKEKLEEMKTLFMSEAKKYNVLPIDDRYGERTSAEEMALKPSLVRGRTHFVYHQGISRIPEGSAPDIKNKDFTVEADVNMASAKEANGVLATIGGRFGGWVMLIQDGHAVVAHSYSNQPQHKFVIKSKTTIPTGKHTLKYDFKYDGGGIGKGGLGGIYLDGKLIASGKVDVTTPTRFSLDECMDIGEDTGTPVLDSYKVPFEFEGKLNQLVIDTGADKLTPDQREEQRKLLLKMIMDNH